jgi:hypothetical protein
MYTKHYIHDGQYIYGPGGYTEFYIHDGKYIYGRSENLPWPV